MHEPASAEGVVLVLHGGASRGDGVRVSPTQLSVIRMIRDRACLRAGRPRPAGRLPAAQHVPWVGHHAHARRRLRLGDRGGAARYRPPRSGWSATRWVGAPPWWPATTRPSARWRCSTRGSTRRTTPTFRPVGAVRARRPGPHRLDRQGDGGRPPPRAAYLGRLHRGSRRRQARDAPPRLGVRPVRRAFSPAVRTTRRSPRPVARCSASEEWVTVSASAPRSAARDGLAYRPSLGLQSTTRQAAQRVASEIRSASLETPWRSARRSRRSCTCRR